MFLSEALKNFVSDSKREQQRARRRKRNLAVAAGLTLLIIMSCFTWWAMKERGKAKENEKIAIEEKNNAIEANKKFEKAKQEADSLRRLAKPHAVISATKMNVLYIGVDNPIDASVSGYASENVMLCISSCGGSLKKTGAGQYIVRVTHPGKTIINISVKDDNGKILPMGAMEFRVKRIPDPVAKVANLKGGSISKEVLLSQTEVKAELENFDFDIKCKVVGFTVMTYDKGFLISQTSNSNKFTMEQLKYIKKATSAPDVYIKNIKVKMVDGTIRNIGTITLNLEE